MAMLLSSCWPSVAIFICSSTVGKANTAMYHSQLLVSLQQLHIHHHAAILRMLYRCPPRSEIPAQIKPLPTPKTPPSRRRPHLHPTSSPAQNIKTSPPFPRSPSPSSPSTTPTSLNLSFNLPAIAFGYSGVPIAGIFPSATSLLVIPLSTLKNGTGSFVSSSDPPQALAHAWKSFWNASSV